MKNQYKALAFHKIYVCIFLGMAVVLLCVLCINVEASNTDSVPIYRMYNPYTGEHFYTSNKLEKGILINVGWSYEGVGWMAPSSSNAPVYRLYNGNVGDHHYTMNDYERQMLISQGWSDEGIGWYSDENESVAIFRQYNPNNITGTHNYTVSEGERDYLINNGWSDESVGWYGTDTGEAVQAVEKSEAELKSLASNYGNVGVWGYADYDGNGSGEAFAVIGNTDAYHDNDVRIQKVIFVGESGRVRTMVTEFDWFAYHQTKDILFCEGKGFFTVEYGAYGSGSLSLLLSVKDEVPYELDISQHIQGLYLDEIGYYTLKNDYSKGYHDYLKQELIYNPNTQQFSKGNTRGSIFD